LNVALFGNTAAEWRKANPKLSGNMRDHAALEQLAAQRDRDHADALSRGIDRRKAPDIREEEMTNRLKCGSRARVNTQIAGM